jgi:hypothetical protein
MKRLNYLNPKHRHKFTPEQEELIQLSESQHARARILQRGASQVMGEFSTLTELNECAAAILESIKIHEEANRMFREATTSPAQSKRRTPKAKK